MLRHSRAHSHFENKKHKNDKEKKAQSLWHQFILKDNDHINYLQKKNHFSIRDYLKSWGM